MTLGLIDLDGCGDGDRSPNVYLNGAPGPWTHAVFCYVTDGPYGGGDKAIRVVGSGGQAIRLLAQASSHVCVGFHAMRWSSNNPQAGPSFELREGTTVHLKVRFNHSGDVVVYDGANVALGSCFPGATGIPPQETGLFPYRQWTPFAVEVKVADAIIKYGALVQQSNAIESLSNVTVLCLDKTGTLTANRLQVNTVHPIGISEDSLKHILGAMVASAKTLNKTAKRLSRCIAPRLGHW